MKHRIKYLSQLDDGGRKAEGGGELDQIVHEVHPHLRVQQVGQVQEEVLHQPNARKKNTVRNSVIFKLTSVADIFGPPGSGAGSVSRRYGSGFGPFCRKNSKKKFVSYSFLTFYDFLSVKNDVNVASKSTVISRKNCVQKLVFC